MAISRLVAPTDPPTADANWTQLINWVKLALLSIELPFRMDWANGLIKKGAIFYVSGTPYLNDTDVTPSGTVSNYVKLTPSGDGSVLTASYVASLTGVTWNTTYNGWYDGGTPSCLYIFDEHLAKASGIITDIRGNRDVDFYRHERVNIGKGNTTSSAKALSIGDINISSGSYSQTVGYENISSGEQSVSVGIGNKSEGDYSFSAGGQSRAIGTRSVAIGYDVDSIRTDSTGIGGIRREIYTNVTEGVIFTSLYSLLGSQPTARISSAIGSYGVNPINQIQVIDSTTINILNSGNQVLALPSGGSSVPQYKLKILFIDGQYT